MKTLFTLFILTLLAFNAKAQWVELDTGMENPPSFKDVYAITPDIVIVVGNNGTILKTTDGGETWVQKPSGTTEPLRKVQFPTSEIGYAVAAGSTFLKTTDSGETWNPVDTGIDCYFYDFSCVDENNIFITCSGNLLKSEDGGNSWSQIGPVTWNKMQFINNSIGYASQESGDYNFLKTIDGGETWQEFEEISPPFQFLDENIGFYYWSGLHKTIDGGENFEPVSEGLWGDFTAINVVNENNIWGILIGLLNGDGSSHGIIKATYYGSNTYEEIMWFDDDPGLDMYGIHFANESVGYVVGFNHGRGAIWKNSTGINTMGTKEENHISEIKIYPNPVSKEINIDFNKMIPENFTVFLTDLSGKNIFSKTYSNRSEIKIDINPYPKGTYLLSVKTKQKVYSQKIIVN